MSRHLLLLFLALLFFGCAATAKPSGTFGPGSFLHSEYPYTVEYQHPKKVIFVDSNWQLDNFYRPKPGRLDPKRGGRYEHFVKYDKDGDGLYEQTNKGYTYDLRLEHKVFDQTLWLRSVPLDRSYEKKNLDVIMHDYVEAVSGAGYSVVSLTRGLVEIEERRFATKILGQRAFRVAGREALLVVFDVANVDQLALDSEDRTQRVAVLFVRTGYVKRVSKGRKATLFPTVMIVAYASHPKDFARGLPAFETFASRTNLRPGKNRILEKTSAQSVRKAKGARLNLRASTVAALLPETSPVGTVPSAPATPPTDLVQPAATPPVTKP